MPQRAEAFTNGNRTDHPDRDAWLTGDEIIARSGISKSDLIRFIQQGLFPTSMMRVSRTAKPGDRRRSYFSREILARISQLKRLGDVGHDAQAAVEAAAEANREESSESGRATGGPVPTADPQAPPADATPLPHVHLQGDTTAAAAFFVNRELCIQWIQVDRNDRLSRAIRNEFEDDPSGTVFDIMLRASLKELVFNWQPLFTFTYRYLEETSPADIFSRLAPTVSMSPEVADIQADTDRRHSSPRRVDSCPIHLLDDSGQDQVMRFYGIALAEGTLFVLDEERWPDDRTGQPSADAADADAGDDGPADRKIPFSVLSARLDDSRSIVDTLLPETYFQLMKRIWDETDRIMASYGGHRAKRSGTDVQYIIPQQAGTDPAFDAICCAVALKDKMREIETSLKAEGGWFSDLRLNIGISSGKDHLQPDDPTASMAFMLPGGAADQAFHLCTIAHRGAIWITKTAFSHLSRRQIKRIAFGIYREDRLIHNIFARVADLPHAPDTPPMSRSIRSLFVTRIISLRRT